MSATIESAAFGDDPGLWPLPRAADAGQLWMYAVAAGGQGRYAAGRAALAEVLRREPGGGLDSLALSTRASFLRQLGWHWQAHDWDGRAWARAAGDPQAGVDALIGLAADALGVGRLRVSAAVLERAARLLEHADAPPARLEIRLTWVRAELAMAGGDGTAAVGHACRGVEMSEAALPDLRRHRLKSDVVLAAALCCAGDLAASRAAADAAIAETEACRLVPLRWALACLLAGTGSSAHSPVEIARIRDRSADFVTRHGGRWHRR